MKVFVGTKFDLGHV